MNQYTAQSFWVSKKKGSIKKEVLDTSMEKDEIGRAHVRTPVTA